MNPHPGEVGFSIEREADLMNAGTYGAGSFDGELLYIRTAPEVFSERGVRNVEIGGFGEVHELIWRLASGSGEESPKDLKQQNAEIVLFVRFHGSID